LTSLYCLKLQQLKWIYNMVYEANVDSIEQGIALEHVQVLNQDLAASTLSIVPIRLPLYICSISQQKQII
jgi:hypothetical protein